MIYNIIRNQRKNSEVLLILGIKKYHYRPGTADYWARPFDIEVLYSDSGLTERNIREVLRGYAFESSDMKRDKDVVKAVFEVGLK